MKGRIIAFVGLSLLLPTVVVGQVKISIPANHYRAQEQIRAKVENTGSRPVTYCIEIGQTSPKGDGTESTPSPFWVQSDGNGKWGTLVIGPDVGSLRVVQVLQPGKSDEFPFRLNDHGKMRLRLQYWYGAKPNLDCKTPPKGSKLLTSAVFIID
jgi:hypothetical protein